MAKWKDKRNPDPLIKKMETMRFVKDDGQIQFRGSDLAIVPARLENIVELNHTVTQEDKHIIVWRAIRNASKKGVLSSDTVIEEIKKLEKDYLSKRKQKFVLISTLSINSQKCKLPNLQIDRNRITFSPKTAKKFIKHIGESQYIKWHIAKNKIPNDYTWAMVTVSAKGIHDAFQKASRALNLFRGELNYSINYGTRSFSSGSKPKPINKIRYGPMHTLHKPDGKLVDDIFWYEEDNFELAKAYRDIIAGRFDKIMNYISSFRKQLNKSKIKDILENAILLYNAALDSYSFDTAFIKLWATLELLTGTSRDNYDTTVQRAAFIFEDVDATKGHLNILRDCRNKLVHKGHMEGQKEILLYDLKLYVEPLIDFLLWSVQGLKNFEEIKQLLDSCPDKIELVQRKKALENKLRINNMARKLHK
ncbi:MAG: hypothetical protein ACYTFK_11630 [Planctomycetota bacterium]|jgi:hypothetical protein